MSSHQNGKGRSSDDRVLEVIFNPELPAEELEGDNEDPVEGEEEEMEMSEEVRAAKELEVQAVRAAEGGRLDDALQMLTRAITIAPAYPSPYNNRAQVYRLRGDVEAAMEDLNTALQQCNGRGKVGVQAYCQRGLIHRLHERDQEAREDFSAATKMGSKFAKKQLVQMNPYAALCGQMLSEAFDKLRRGDSDD